MKTRIRLKNLNELKSACRFGRRHSMDEIWKSHKALAWKVAAATENVRVSVLRADLGLRFDPSMF
jgi:hypothetical protein